MVGIMHELLVRLDCLTTTRHSTVFKVDCIGDGVMLATNLTSPDHHHARSLVNFLKDLLVEAKQIATPVDGSPLQLRAGIHSGPAASALLGLVHRKYSLWGDTVNVAARLENVGAPGAIHVSSDTFELLQADSIALLGPWATAKVLEGGSCGPPSRLSSGLPVTVSQRPTSAQGLASGGASGVLDSASQSLSSMQLDSQELQLRGIKRGVSRGILRTISLDPETQQHQVVLPVPVAPPRPEAGTWAVDRSLLDLFGDGIVVCTGPNGERFVEEKWMYCGRIEVRGKGAMRTYLLEDF